MDRRSQERCEICQGPTKADGGKVVCRNSLCSFNHQEVECPRCKAKGPDATGYNDDKINYSCKDCLNTWSA